MAIKGSVFKLHHLGTISKFIDVNKTELILFGEGWVGVNSLHTLAASGRLQISLRIPREPPGSGAIPPSSISGEPTWGYSQLWSIVASHWSAPWQPDLIDESEMAF
jgi:hypothetical protein